MAKEQRVTCCGPMCKTDRKKTFLALPTRINVSTLDLSLLYCIGVVFYCRDIGFCGHNKDGRFSNHFVAD